jgi:uncharacterized protein DUF4255
MSNTVAIAAVTATLRSLLEKEIAHEGGGLQVTTLPPDKAQQAFSAGGGASGLNLFLYQTQINPSWRNMDPPGRARPNEIAYPTLALDLHYLVTAYEKGDDPNALLAHRLLARAMLVLHDHPFLGADELRIAPPDNDLADQIERVRVTPHTMSLEELSKLWMIFQTGYRISTAYQVSLVLIDSRRASRTAPPVLQRGQEDRGVSATAGDTMPILEEVRLPNRQSSALLGDKLTVIGQNLGDLSAVRFTLVSSGLDTAPTFPRPAAEAVSVDEGFEITLPDDAAAHAAWWAGFYTVAVLVDRVVDGKAQTWSSNELPFSLAPRVQKIVPANPVARDGNGKVELTLTCQPEVRLAVVDPTHTRFDQQIVLLLGSARQIAPEAPTAPSGPSTDKVTFIFPVADDEVGEYLVRLRVDGVDLPLVERKEGHPPQFDPSQKVTIT